MLPTASETEAATTFCLFSKLFNENFVSRLQFNGSGEMGREARSEPANMLLLIKLIYFGIDSLCIINRHLTQWSLNEILAFASVAARMELYGNYFCLTRCFTFVDTPTKNNSPKGGQLITDLHDLTPPWVALRAPRALKSYFASTIAFFLSATYKIDGEKKKLKPPPIVLLRSGETMPYKNAPSLNAIVF